MIELYRTDEDPEADRVEAALQEMAVAHRVRRCSREEASALLEVDVSLPALREDDRVAFGSDAIARFLDDTERSLEAWRKFQTDACYLDDDGEVC